MASESKYNCDGPPAGQTVTKTGPTWVLHGNHKSIQGLTARGRTFVLLDAVVCKDGSTTSKKVLKNIAEAAFSARAAGEPDARVSDTAQPTSLHRPVPLAPRHHARPQHHRTPLPPHHRAAEHHAPIHLTLPPPCPAHTPPRLLYARQRSDDSRCRSIRV